MTSNQLALCGRSNDESGVFWRPGQLLVSEKKTARRNSQPFSHSQRSYSDSMRLNSLSQPGRLKVVVFRRAGAGSETAAQCDRERAQLSERFRFRARKVRVG